MFKAIELTSSITHTKFGSASPETYVSLECHPNFKSSMLPVFENPIILFNPYCP